PAPRVYGYSLSGDRVVFAFRPEEYEFVTTNGTGEWIRMDDLRVTRVAVSGEFNRWSNDNCPLARSGGEWVAERPVSEFDAARPQRFKFIVNGKFWAEPPLDALNRLPISDGSRVANLVLRTDRATGAAPAGTHAEPPVHR